MARFVECSVAEVTYLRSQKIVNNPVNIDLCKQIKKSTVNWYPDNTGKPSLVFEGCDAHWTYNSEGDRDADYARFANNAF